MKRAFRTYTVGLLILFMVPQVLYAESGPDPRVWRQMIVTDLSLPGPHHAHLVGLWADRIAANNRKAMRNTQSSPLPGNAPARVASITVRSLDVVVLLSLFHAQGACETVAGSSRIQHCPMRLMRLENGATSVREGRGCFALPHARPADGASFPPEDASPVAYASYDIATRAIRLGVVSEGEAVEGCSQSVPVRGE